jgi:hypothetical protein
MNDRLRLRHIHGVAAFDLDDRCTGALRHQLLGSGGITLSSVVSRYQLGFTFYAGSQFAPLPFSV